MKLLLLLLAMVAVVAVREAASHCEHNYSPARHIFYPIVGSPKEPSQALQQDQLCFGSFEFEAPNGNSRPHPTAYAHDSCTSSS